MQDYESRRKKGIECQDWNHAFQTAASYNIIIFAFSSECSHENAVGRGWRNFLAGCVFKREIV